ncbi:MAG: RIP metalloprotease RseP [Nevskiaceae bacterium]
MLEVLWSIAAFIVALALLVSFHEFGHFWVARTLGVKVLRFSVGFGRALWRRVGRDGVEYVVAAVPLGGYVKMLDEREGEVAPAELPRAFNRQPVWKRIAIVVAGPAANFLLAFVVYWMVFVAGTPALKAIVAAPPAGSRAATIGLQAGDEVLAVGGAPTQTFQQLRVELIDRALSGAPAEIQVRAAGGSTRTAVVEFGGVRVDPQYLFDDLGLHPYQPPAPAVLGEIVKGSAAEAAGLKSGDRVLSIDGTPITYYQELFDWVRAHPGSAARLDVRRGDATLALTAIIRAETQGDKTYGRLGAGVDVPDALWENLVTEHRLSIWAAAPAAVVETARMSALTLRMLYHMVLGDVSVKNVTGPIQIAQFAGYTASIGLVSFLSFIAIMSVSLAVLNLLPVPLLDGGHLLYYVVEMVKGSPLSDRAQAVGQQVGLTLLIALMGLAFYNDILRLIH